MSDSVIVALITGAAAVIGQWLITRKGRNEDRIERAKLDQKTADRLSAIEHKIDIHNGYAEKLAEITADIRVIRNEIEHLKAE